MATKPSFLSHKFKWNQDHLRQIEEVFNDLMLLRSKEDGAFFLTSKRELKSAYSTIECLFPFLLFPFSHKYSQVIDAGVKYVLRNTSIDGVADDSQFTDSNIPAVDTTAFGVYVFAMARNYYLEETQGHRNSLLLDIENMIKGWITFIYDNRNNSGWGFLKNSESRVQSTALVLGALSNCDESDFSSRTQKTQMLKHGIDYLISQQATLCNHDVNKPCDENCIKGGWSCKDATGNAVINPHVTATAIFALNSSLRANFPEAEASINLGAEYLKRLDLHKASNELEAVVEHVVVRTINDVALKHSSKKIFKFEHPYYMVLPALLMTGHLGFHDERILILYRKIVECFKSFQPNKESYGYWVFSDIANALILFFSTANVSRNSDLIFSSSGFCPSCNRTNYRTLIKNHFTKACSQIRKWFLPFKGKKWKWIFIISLILLDLFVVCLIYIIRPAFFGDLLNITFWRDLFWLIGLTVFFPINIIWKKYKIWENELIKK